MSKKIQVIHKDFKIALHEYDDKTERYGAQCSEAKMPDKIIKTEGFEEFQFNVFTLACLANIFDKEHLIILFRMLNLTNTKEYGTYFSIYNFTKTEMNEKLIIPCNLYELADALDVKFSDVKLICDILLRDGVLYEFDCYIDRFHSIKEKCYFFDSKFIYSDCSWLRKEDLVFNNEDILLWYQSNQYDKEYNDNPELFEQKCLEGWRGEKQKDNKDTRRESPLYREWLKSVLIRDKSTCQCCGSTLNPQVHHIKNYRQYKNLRTEITNGITLCQ